MPFNLSDHADKMTEEQLSKIDQVKEEQMKIGMQPRNDSILTYNYATGNVPEYLNSPFIIAHELKIVDYIYKNTDYGSIIEDVMREIANFIKRKYRLDWNTTWEMVRFYVPDMLKMYCIRKNNLTIS